MNSSLASATLRGSFEERALRLHDALGLGPVSYTHLTLPTICSV